MISKIISRKEVAQILCTTPAAISCRVSRRDWSAVPEPFKIGKNYFWLRESVELWISEKASQGIGTTKFVNRRGRPPKRRSA